MIGALLLRMAIPRFCAALSRKDLEAVFRDLSDEAVFEFPGESDISGTYEGEDAIRALWSRVFERYETFTMTPKRVALARPYALGMTNTALMEWRVDVVTWDGVELHADGVAVVDVRRGKMVSTRHYFFDPTLLEMIWGKRGSATTGKA